MFCIFISDNAPEISMADRHILFFTTNVFAYFAAKIVSFSVFKNIRPKARHYFNSLFKECFWYRE